MLPIALLCVLAIFFPVSQGNKVEDLSEKEGNEIDLLMLLAKVLKQLKGKLEIICSLAKFFKLWSIPQQILVVKFFYPIFIFLF